MSNLTTESDNPKKRRWAGWILMALSLLGGAVYGLHLYHLSQVREVTDNAQISADITRISPRVSGQVTEVLVRDNDVVAEGQLLFTLDSSDFESRVAKAESSLKAARTRMKEAELQVVSARRSTSAQIQERSSAIDVSVQQVSSADQAVAVAQAERGQSSAAIEQARAEISRSKAELSKAQAEAERLHGDVQRYALLFEKREVAEQRFEAVKTAAVQADAQEEAARQNVVASEAVLANALSAQAVADENIRKAQVHKAEMLARVGEAQGRMEQARAGEAEIAVAMAAVDTAATEVDRAQAELTQARLDLSYTKVFAPTTGRVTHKNIELGQFVQVGSPAMALVDENDVWVVANFKETQMEHIEAGLKVGLVVDTYPEAGLEGTVESIQAGTGAIFSLLPPENASGNFVKVVQRIPVKIVMSPQEQKKLVLRPGMSVEATVWLP